MFQKIFTKLNISPWCFILEINRFSKCKFSFPQKHADLYRVVMSHIDDH